MSLGAAKVSGLMKGAPEVLAVIIDNLQFKNNKKTEIQYLFAPTRHQFQDFTEINIFYHMMFNVAAKVSGIT